MRKAIFLISMILIMVFCKKKKCMILTKNKQTNKIQQQICSFCHLEMTKVRCIMGKFKISKISKLKWSSLNTFSKKCITSNLITKAGACTCFTNVNII